MCRLHIYNCGYRIKQDFAFKVHSITVEKKMYFVVNFVYSHLVHIRWFTGVIGLLYRVISIFKSCKLIQYLHIAFMRWFPFTYKIYGSIHRCVNILTIESLKESMNLFVLPICFVSQAWSSPICSRKDRIREHQFVNPVPSSSSSIL